MSRAMYVRKGILHTLERFQKERGDRICPADKFRWLCFDDDADLADSMQPLIGEGFIMAYDKGYALTDKWLMSLERRVMLLEQKLDSVSGVCDALANV